MSIGPARRAMGAITVFCLAASRCPKTAAQPRVKPVGMLLGDRQLLGGRLESGDGRAPVQRLRQHRYSNRNQGEHRADQRQIGIGNA